MRCFIITGASRGFGRAVAVLCGGDAVVLVARSTGDLETTKAKIFERESSPIKVSSVKADLSQLDTLDCAWDEILDLVPEGCTRLVFLNNAGSLGHVGRCTSKANTLADMQDTLNLNVTSAIWSSIRVARYASTQDLIATCWIVNVSSLVALQPFGTMAVYSAGKAARDSYHTAMVRETVVGNNIRILNYAPGPLETAMVDHLRAVPDLDASLRPHFAKRVLDPADSAAVLLSVLEQDTFENGQHLDYYDVVGASPSDTCDTP